MRSDTLDCVVRRLRCAVAPAAAPAGTDAELIRDFVRNRDTAAFEAIVRRHGPMVLGVCRRLLRQPADADDAFQATFLVLVRRAGELRHPERLAGWLHQVAHRTARKLRATRRQRLAREGELFDVPAGEPPADFVWRELRPIFDQELNRLPDRLRLPAVLCFLQGHSKGEAARTLGWPEGTLAGRLQQAREKLRARFVARGLTLSAGALAVALFEGIGSAAVPDRLIASTLQTAAAGRAGMAGAWALADGVIQAMVISKLKATAAAVLVAGVVGTGTGVVLVPGAGPGPAIAAQPKQEGGPPPGGAPGSGGAAARERDEVWTDYRRNWLTLRVKLLQSEMERESRLVAMGTIPRAESRLKQFTDEVEVVQAELKRLGEQVNFGERFLQAEGLKMLKDRLAWEERMFAKGYITQAQLNKTKADIAQVEAELKKLEPVSPRDLDRETLELNLRELKDRLAFEERMVARGFMTKTQLERTKLEVARAEQALAKQDAPKPADPRRAALEALIRKQEEIVALTAESVHKGVVPRKELLEAEQALLTSKIKLAELRDQPATSVLVSDERRSALEATIIELERIVAQIREGLNRGFNSRRELLDAEATLLRHKYELLDPADRSAADSRLARPPADRRADSAELRKALITLKENELRRAEQLHKQNVVSAEDVRRLRIDLAALRAEAAGAAGDLAAAVRERDAVVAEWEAVAAAARKRVEQRGGPRAELRTIEVALAEAKVEAHRAGVRRQLAEIVRLREQELAEAKILHDAKAISNEELRRAETALTEARLRLAEDR